MLVLAVALLAAALDSSAPGLQRELARLGVDTALVLPTSALDDGPIWSPDSRYVAACVTGSWLSVDLRSIKLLPATWHGKRSLGVVEQGVPAKPLEAALLTRWTRPAVNSDRAQSHTVRVEFLRKDSSTSLVVTRSGGNPSLVWTSERETCGAPALSPDGALVAFFCERHGILVMVLK